MVLALLQTTNMVLPFCSVQIVAVAILLFTFVVCGTRTHLC